ncbi:MAG: hypothetical protein Q7J98_00735 [Kiritimatiellia bacterium]|nr:hypothetical protein [Kiritimatiellia bacterium]
MVRHKTDMTHPCPALDPVADDLPVLIRELVLFTDTGKEDARPAFRGMGRGDHRD